MEEDIDPNEAELRRALWAVVGREAAVEDGWLQSLLDRGLVRRDGECFEVTASGRRFLASGPHRPEEVRRHVIRHKQLVAVLPVGEERVLSGGGRLVVTGAEVWSDEVVVRVALLGLEPLRRGPGYCAWELHDGERRRMALTEGGDSSGLTSLRHVRFWGPTSPEPTTWRLTPSRVEPVRPFEIPWPGLSDPR